MGLLKFQMVLSTTALLVISEASLAYYNADDHEARIRRSCNSLRDSDERMGCFTGDITMIEQIRRRQRAEMRKNGGSFQGNRPSRKVPRVTQPEEIITATEPDLSTQPQDQGASPQLITRPAVEPAILPGPRLTQDATDKPIPQTAEPAQQGSTTQVPEALRPQPEAPKLPERFPMTCAHTYNELQQKPHLRDAMARIMKTTPMKRGEIRQYKLNGWYMDPKQCLGLFTRTLRNCTDQSTSDKTTTRIDSETGRIQAHIGGQWVNQKTCSDGEKIVSSAVLSTSGFTFHFKTTVRQSKGQVQSSTTGYLENDPTYLVNFGENVLNTSQDSTRMVASQGRAPRGRN